ncbi:MAG: TetR/AcrR family transcriptional regulator [Kutzneria sp.]|nr:TetR/AcrR family transcriptional regulator [Kutzneria sp.]
MPRTASAGAQRAPSGARADGKRRAIVEAALTVFLTDGFDVSMDRVAAAAGVSKVTVYNHFGSKDNLFLAVISGRLGDALRQAEGLVESHLVESADVRAALVRACRAWVAGLTTPDMIGLRNLVAGEMRRFPELGKAWMEEGPARLHAVIAAALRRLSERKTLCVPDVELAVLQLSGLVVSPTVLYGAYGHGPSHRLTDRLIVAGVDMFLQYYGYDD